MVIDVRTVADRRGVTGLDLVFDEALDPATARDLFNYELVSEGRDGRFGTFDDAPVAVRAATYDPATFRVTLTPARPLRLGTFTRVTVNRTEIPVAGRNVTDVAGNLLDGNRDGIPGGRYVALIGRGVNLRYVDRDGDRVALQLLRGGTLELRRAFNGEAEQLRILNPVPGRSELAGHLRIPRTGSDGRTTLPVILGARGVRNRLRNPPYVIGRISEAAVDALLAVGESARERPDLPAVAVAVAAPARRLRAERVKATRFNARAQQARAAARRSPPPGASARLTRAGPTVRAAEVGVSTRAGATLVAARATVRNQAAPTESASRGPAAVRRARRGEAPRVRAASI
jgi:hypothetical protein